MPKSVNLINKYEHPTLPLRGWFKICSNNNCRAVTHYFVKYKNYKFYFCKYCLKKIDCNSYIENEFNYLFENY